MTNTRRFDGHGSTWGSLWWKMISFHKMTSPTSTKSVRKEIGSCMPTLPSQFEPRHIVNRMMCFFLRSKGHWWDSSTIHQWEWNTRPIGINVHMRAQWGNFNGCNFWCQWCEVPPLHLNGVWFTSDQDPGCMDCHFMTNTKWFDRMVSPIKS